MPPLFRAEQLPAEPSTELLCTACPGLVRTPLSLRHHIQCKWGRSRLSRHLGPNLESASLEPWLQTPFPGSRACSAAGQRLEEEIGTSAL